MPYSKTCKLGALAGIGLSAIIILMIIYSFSPRVCPNDGELMYRPTATCYPKESKGPCKNNLVILGESENRRNSYGECNCPITQFTRTMLFNRDTESCHFVFTQAYCSPGQWLTINPKDGTATCEKNRCLHHSVNGLSENEPKDSSPYGDGNVQWVPIKGGGCARLGFHEEGCPPGSVIKFHKDYVLPSCFTPPKQFNSKLGSIGVPASNCKLGSYPSIMGKCQPQFQFDFD